MNGVAGMTLALGLIAMLIVGSIFLSAFTGGHQSEGLFGWEGIPILEGIEAFFTSIYNTAILFSQWITITILLIVFLAVQVAFVFFYYKAFKFLWQFKPAVERFIEEISNV